MELPDLPTVIPPLGVLGLLGWLVVHFMRQASADRRDYRSALRDQQRDHDQDIDATVARYERQIANLQAELDQTRERLAEARRARWRAEDQVARYRRIVGDVDDPSSAS